MKHYKLLKLNKTILFMALYLLFSTSVFSELLKDFLQEANAVEIEMQKAISVCKKMPEPISSTLTSPHYLMDCAGHRAYVFKRYAEAQKPFFVETWSTKESIANEVLAYLIDRFIFGNGTTTKYGVPPTYPIRIKLKDSEEAIMGSAQKYIPDSSTIAQINLTIDIFSSLDLTPLHFQFLTLNADANKNNVLFDKKSIYPIDNGFILVGRKDIAAVTNRSWFAEYAPKEQFFEDDEKTFSDQNLEKADERLKELVDFIKTKFNTYELTNEKRLIFRIGLQLAKQIATSNRKIGDWLRVLKSDFGNIVDIYLSKIDQNTKEWLDLNSLIDWDAVKSSLSQAIK